MKVYLVLHGQYVEAGTVSWVCETREIADDRAVRMANRLGLTERHNGRFQRTGGGRPSCPEEWVEVEEWDVLGPLGADGGSG